MPEYRPTFVVVESLDMVQIFDSPEPVAVDLSAHVPDEAFLVDLRLEIRACPSDASLGWACTGHSIPSARGMIELYADGRLDLPFRKFTYSESGLEWNYDILNFPVVTTPKRIFRQIFEYMGDLDSFRLILMGWR